MLAGLESLFVVVLVAALAPLLSAVIPGGRIPQLVLLILGGILIGPSGFGLAKPSEIELLANVGLGFVFLLAGFEIQPAILRTRVAGTALIAWISSCVLAAVIVGGLAAVGFVHAYVPVGLALTTTALGTVLPILRERGLHDQDLGRYFLPNGAIGEMLPILAIAIFLGVNNRFSALISLAAIGLLALALAYVPRLLRERRVARIIAAGADTTGQTTLRWSVLLLLGFLVLAADFGLDVVLGAMLAGMVLRRYAPGNVHALEVKLDAVGYGFFIPVFFVSAGMGVNLDSITESPARLPVFLVLLLVVRGLPVFFLYRRTVRTRLRVQLMFCTATTLPLIVALTEIGLRNGTMLPENAAALTGAAVLSVLVYPAIAVALERPGGSSVPGEPAVRRPSDGGGDDPRGRP
ncbi:transporter (CPA2 family) [Kribbella amoyensis]|uniref:Transporter (CPA2 family) n=1 Tax=Kribbella amoyensis TaxID=996641 RepID=A0A561BR63_9ACTN|nr:cation:proton antiporter [Kribbella amoyensis]TWD81365.1 transporter (CPA2 family) [Kribbella amoyensis]